MIKLWARNLLNKYYGQHKVKSKKRGRPGNKAIQVITQPKIEPTAVIITVKSSRSLSYSHPGYLSGMCEVHTPSDTMEL